MVGDLLAPRDADLDVSRAPLVTAGLSCVVTSREYRAALADTLPASRADLESLVRIPSISSAPEHATDVQRAVDHVAELAREAGAQSVDVVSAAGHPALIAHWPAPDGAPTVLLYAHADVQPTGAPAEWTSPPFEPTERDGRLYGRGAADDKAGVVMHLAALRAFGGRPPVGVVLFIEGEEEIGSPTLTAILAAHRDRLRADVIVIADSANAGVQTPAFTTSLRGGVDLTVEVRLLDTPVHSGMFGGPAGDALTVLCRLIATLHNHDGSVAVGGLHVGESLAPDVPDETFRADAGLVPGAQLLGCDSIPTRLWNRPAIAVIGLDATPTAEASNVLIPRARAKISLRIAPGDDATSAMKALHRHLENNVDWGAEVTISDGITMEPYQLEASGAVYDLAREAFADAYGNAAVETGVGGSIPFIATFARTYPGATVLVTGVGDPKSRWHGIDESLHLAMWERACLAEVLLLDRLSRQPSAPA
jgi:acetylornithine deacetylase/succinyl-diaminopimelate desuccinylase-like protein